MLRSTAPLPAIIVTLLVAGSSPRCDAGDWPQILGPRRDGTAVGEKLVDRWPAEGPRRLWSHELGEGFAGPAVVGDRVLAFHRIDGQERVEAFETASGAPVWRRDFPSTYQGGVNPDRGPRCVPTVRDGRVFVFGAAGDLHCLRLGDGKALWSRSAGDDFNSPDSYFGAGSSPIVVDGRVLVNVGGRASSSGVVAYDVQDGRTVWTATDEAASYSSPTLATIDGRTAVVFVARLNTVFLDPRDGRVLLTFPFGKRGPTVNAATPIVSGQRLFVTASYGIGARCVRFGARGIEEIWANDDSLSSQYATGVLSEGWLFGIHGREDIGVAQLRCVSLEDGRVGWSVAEFGVANLILADDKLLIVGVDGKLTLARADEKSFDKLAETRLTDTVTRALPALSGGRLFLRSNSDRSGRLLCLEVGAP